ncbi:MAG: hypothetical protein ACREQW_17695 [Candidatus Binatia bacterium]
MRSLWTAAMLAGAFLVMGMSQISAAQLAQVEKQSHPAAQRREESRKPEPDRSRRDYDGARTQRKENEALRRLQEPNQYERQREAPLERQRREAYEAHKQPEPEKERKPPGLTNCVAAYVRREAFPGDRVCVTVETRAQAMRDNIQAPSRRNPLGPHGLDSCIEGYVWREAFPGDRVCVTPETRALTARDNSEAVNRTAR